MRRFLGVVVSVVAALGLVAGPAMAAQVLVLSDAQLAGVWGGVLDDNAIAGTDAANNNSNIDSNNDSSTNVDVDVDVDVLSNVQNGASGLNLSNALLSQVAQQNNISAGVGAVTSVLVQVNVVSF